MEYGSNLYCFYELVEHVITHPKTLAAVVSIFSLLFATFAARSRNLKGRLRFPYSHTHLETKGHRQTDKSSNPLGTHQVAKSDQDGLQANSSCQDWEPARTAGLDR